jgi:hypothetical protein
METEVLDGSKAPKSLRDCMTEYEEKLKKRDYNLINKRILLTFLAEKHGLELMRLDRITSHITWIEIREKG